MSATEAFRLAVAQLREQSPWVVAAKAGVEFDGQHFRVPFFRRYYLVDFPLGRVGGEAGEIPTLWIQVLILHYLSRADGTPVADRWVSCRELPGGYFVADQKFEARAQPPLARLYGSDGQGLAQASQVIGGIPMPGIGDAAYRFLAFPRLPLACIFYFSDEEMPASAKILYDAHASHYLPTDDLIDLGIYLSLCLQSFKVPGLNPDEEVI